MSVGLNDKAEFACEVADEALEGVWMRNGKKVSEGDRVKIVSEGKSRKLMIEQVSAEDQGEYEFRVEGSETLRLTASLSMKESELNNNVVNITIEKPKGTFSPVFFITKLNLSLAQNYAELIRRQKCVN